MTRKYGKLTPTLYPPQKRHIVKNIIICPEFPLTILQQIKDSSRPKKTFAVDMITAK